MRMWAISAPPEPEGVFEVWDASDEHWYRLFSSGGEPVWIGSYSGELHYWSALVTKKGPLRDRKE